MLKNLFCIFDSIALLTICACSISCSQKDDSQRVASIQKTNRELSVNFAYADSLMKSIIDTISPQSSYYVILSQATCRDCAEQIFEACINSQKEVCVITLGAPFEEILKNNIIYSRKSNLRFVFTHPSMYDTLEKHDKRISYNLLYAIKRASNGAVISYGDSKPNLQFSDLKPDSVIKFLLMP